MFPVEISENQPMRNEPRDYINNKRRAKKKKERKKRTCIQTSTQQVGETINAKTKQTKTRNRSLVQTLPLEVQ